MSWSDRLIWIPEPKDKFILKSALMSLGKEGTKMEWAKVSMLEEGSAQIFDDNMDGLL